MNRICGLAIPIAYRARLTYCPDATFLLLNNSEKSLFRLRITINIEAVLPDAYCTRKKSG